MTREDIGPRAKEVLAKYMGEITDDTVVGLAPRFNFALQNDLLTKIGLPMFIESSSVTATQFISMLEGEWDKLSRWERERLLAKP